jgi:hypothetical protein
MYEGRFSPVAIVKGPGVTRFLGEWRDSEPTSLTDLPNIVPPQFAAVEYTGEKHFSWLTTEFVASSLPATIPETS